MAALPVLASSPSSTLRPVSMTPPDVLAGATSVGAVPPATKLSMSISLAPANRAAFQAYADAVSNPRSPEYHHFLTPAQVGQRFGAPKATVDAVVKYLKSKGLQVTMVADSRLAILFSGRADKVQTAFSTKLYNYRVASRPSPGPLQFRSYATVPKVPASFAPSVVTIQGLENANPPMPKTSALRPQDAREVYAASTIYGSSAVGGHKGEGINIGITNFDGYRLSNIPVYANSFGLPAPSGGYGSNVHKVIVGGVDGETVNPGAEGDLDFQMVLASAPKCNLYIYDGIGGGLIATLAQEAQDNVVDIVSESYGFLNSDDFYMAAHDQHLAMTAQGITYMGASGDNGTLDMIRDPYPDFDPDVLMVGGSDVTLNASGGRGTEVGWDGSGSGWYAGSVYFNVLPPYQVGTTVPTGINRRLIPDLALHATNWYFSFNNSIGNVGGTSASSPNFAGQLGIVLQQLAENDAVDPAPNGRPRLGRIQDFIYGLDGDPSAFLDLLGGDAGPLPNGQEAVGKTGWDFVTGWGAPIDQGLYEAFLNGSSMNLLDGPASVGIYTIPTTHLTLGQNPTGDTTSVTSSDGASYSVQSVRQAGVGQVAAATIDVPLQTARARRSASLSVAINSPSLTTGYVYVFNNTTNVFDLVKTVTGRGTTQAVTVPFDATSTSPYVAEDGSVQVLIRAMRPSRLGSSPFRLDIDQATITEKIARN
jgi:subtilase family serine protease